MVSVYTDGASIVDKSALRSVRATSRLDTQSSCPVYDLVLLVQGGIMHRRTFLKHGFTASAAILLGGLPRGFPQACATETAWRTFEVTTRLTILEAPGAVRAWAP